MPPSRNEETVKRAGKFFGFFGNFRFFQKLFGFNYDYNDNLTELSRN